MMPMRPELSLVLNGWCVAILFLAGCSGANTPPTAKGRIVSTNPCADAILMEIADPQRIAAISHYSHDPRSGSIPLALARRFAQTAGTAEEVIALAPDLVIFGTFEPAASRAAFVRAGIRTVPVGVPGTIAEGRAQVMEIANAIGEPVRGRALVARIDAAVAAAVPPPGTRPVSALLWHGGGLVSGGGTLDDELLRRTGFRNASVDYGLRFTGTLPIEQVVARPPRVMLVPSSDTRGGDEGRMRAVRQRAMARIGTAVEASFPEKLSWCAGPVIIPAITRLAQIRRGLGT